MSRMSDMVYKMRGITANKEPEFIHQMEMGILPPYTTPKVRVEYGVLKVKKGVINGNCPRL